MQNPTTMNKGKWTDEEQALFVDCVTKYGRNYDIICLKIKTRTKTQIYTHVQTYFAKLETAAKKKEMSKGTTDTSKDVEMEDAKESGAKRKRRKSSIETEAKRIARGVNKVGGAAPCQVSVDSSQEAKATSTRTTTTTTTIGVAANANANRVSLESTIQQPSAHVRSPPPPSAGAATTTTSSKTKKAKSADKTKVVAKAESPTKASDLQVEQQQQVPVKAFYQRDDVQLLLSFLAGAGVVWVVRNMVL
jgi:SHAQKYF class myb-like DNA-binding protein